MFHIVFSRRILRNCYGKYITTLVINDENKRDEYDQFLHYASKDIAIMHISTLYIV